ncbi:MAG: hypothetical protein WC766_01525 [Patescibacteria group bacterium]
MHIRFYTQQAKYEVVDGQCKAVTNPDDGSSSPMDERLSRCPLLGGVHPGMFDELIPADLIAVGHCLKFAKGEAFFYSDVVMYVQDVEKDDPPPQAAIGEEGARQALATLPEIVLPEPPPVSVPRPSRAPPPPPQSVPRPSMRPGSNDGKK